MALTSSVPSPSGSANESLAAPPGLTAWLERSLTPTALRSSEVASHSAPPSSTTRMGTATAARGARRRSCRCAAGDRRPAWGSRHVRTSRRRSSSTGFGKKSTAPSCTHSRAWLSAAMPEIATIGMRDSRVVWSCRKSSPLMPGR